MKKIAFLFLILANNSFAQVDWRFGFEYNELDSPNPIPYSCNDTLLTHLQYVTASQQLRGGINTNGSGWSAMQSSAVAPIDFTLSDAWVQLFQSKGFEYVYYLTCNAEWSHLNNTACIPNPTFPNVEECAPDAASYLSWMNYVKAVVERYDGDGVNDMPGLTIPIRFYVMSQEVYFAGSAGGDADEAAGKGYWNDNVHNAVKLHQQTYAAMKQADPTGNSKLIGSGGWLFDLYSDFPDYPAVNGPTTMSRINGNNISGANYSHGFDSLIYLMQKLADTTGGKKCDYIGWHPHSGWKASDQSMKFIKTYAPNMPIFCEDMWSPMLYAVLPHCGYQQFIGNDSVYGDFPNSLMNSCNQLANGLNTHNTNITNWYNAHNAREITKCASTLFGEGAERVGFSLTNDVDSLNPFYLFSDIGGYRYTGLTRNRFYNYAGKPIYYTMKLLVDKLHDFASVTELALTGNHNTRVYRFTRARGTYCYVLWSESNPNPADPSIPNGETVSFPVISDTLVMTNIITTQGQTIPVTTNLLTPTFTLTKQLGFEPIIIEETDPTPLGIHRSLPLLTSVQCFPNPFVQNTNIKISLSADADILLNISDEFGRTIKTFYEEKANKGDHTFVFESKLNAPGVYFYTINIAGQITSGKMILIK